MPKEPKKRLFWYWNYITMLFLFFSKTNAAKAQLGKVAFTSSKLDSIKKMNINNALSGRTRGNETTINNPAIKAEVIARKKLPLEVVLNRLNTVAVIKPIQPPGIIMGQMVAPSYNSHKPVYVIDEIQYPDGLPAGFNWSNVDKVDILKYNEAAAVYGAAASNGVVIITTKKKVAIPVYKDLDSVKIISYPTTKHGCPQRMGAVSTVSVQARNIFKDSLNILATKINGTLKVYPNPVKKGDAFNIALKLKDAGAYNAQIIDASGRMMLQQPIVAGTKQYTGQLQTSNTWSSGVYYIRILNSDNKMVSTNSVLVQ